MSVTGKSVMITGPTEGIGRATALAFAEQGAMVAIASRTREPGEQVAQTIREGGGQALWIQTDVTQAAQCNLAQERLTLLIGQGTGHVRIDKARGHGVDGDTTRADLTCQ